MKNAFRTFLPGLLVLLAVTSCDSDRSQRKIKLKSPEAKETARVEDSSTATLKIEPEKRRSIAVLYFENLTGDPSLDWMERGIAEMLVTSLSQSRYLDVTTLERLYGLMRKMGQTDHSSLDVRFASAVAEQARVEAVLMGRLRRDRGTLVFEVDLYEMSSGGIVGTERVSGRIEQAFTLVDDLSRRVKSELRLQYAEVPEVEAPLSRVTTSSLQAYEYYNKGRWHSERIEVNRAIEFFEKAVAEDPQFALAYAELSDEYLRAGDDLQSAKAMEKALLYLERATPIDQEYIRGAKAVYDLDYDVAAEKYRRVIAADSSRIDAYVRLGEVYLGLQQIAQAEDLMTKAIAFNDYSPMVQIILGECYLYSGRIAEARRQFEIANQLNPNSAISRVLLGAIYGLSGRTREATHEFRTALEMQPNNLSALINLGILYAQEEGNAQAAIELFKRGLEVSPNSSAVRLYLGRVYARVGRYKEALALFDRAGELHQRMRPAALVSSASVYFRLQDQKRAEKAIDEFIDLHPDTAAARCTVARLYFDEELLAKAEAQAEAARQSRPDLLCALDMLSAILLHQGRYDEAIGYIREAMKLAPNSSSYHTRLARALNSRDRYEEALAECEMSLQRDSNDVGAYGTIHWIHTELRQDLKALEAVELANKEIPSFDRGYQMQAESYLRLGRRQEAMQAFAKMRTLTTDSLVADRRIAAVLLDNDLVEEALPYLRRAVEERPEAVWTHCNLAEGLTHNGQLEEAIGEYRAALELKPDDLDCIRDLGHTFRRAKRHEEARQMYREYASKNLSPIRKCYAEKWLAMSYADVGQYRRALHHLAKAHKYAQEDHSLRMALDVLTAQANLMHELGRYEDAIELYQRVLAKDVESDLTRAYVGLSYLSMNDTVHFQATVDTLQTRLRRGAPEAHVRYLYELRAESALRDGKTDLALSSARAAAAVRRDRGPYYDYLLARCLYRTGNLDSTLLFCDRVLNSVENNFFLLYIVPKARLLKAQALVQEGKIEQALGECERVLHQYRAADRGLAVAALARQLRQEIRNQLDGEKAAMIPAEHLNAVAEL